MFWGSQFFPTTISLNLAAAIRKRTAAAIRRPLKPVVGRSFIRYMSETIEDD